jgi:hypothetical protein
VLRVGVGMSGLGERTYSEALALDGDGELSIDSETANKEGSITFLKWAM